MKKKIESREKKKNKLQKFYSSFGKTLKSGLRMVRQEKV